MKHGVAGFKLSRDTNARKALLNNLADSLFLRGQIKTTLAKAKFAKVYVEKSITKAKKDRLATNRILASSLSGESMKKLFDEIAPGFANRNGGYTRIIKLPSRKGDNAPLARLELLEWDKSKVKTSPGKKTRKVITEKKIKAQKPSPVSTKASVPSVIKRQSKSAKNKSSKPTK